MPGTVPHLWDSDYLAAQRNTTVEHIAQNRLADAQAKKTANDTAIVFTETQNMVEAAVALHEQWLVDVHTLLPTDRPDRSVHKCEAEAENIPSQAMCQQRFPFWAWGGSIQLYPWKPNGTPRALIGSHAANFCAI